MRLISAIIAFVIAIVLVGVGVAQRTVFLAPGSVSAATAEATKEDYIYIGAEALRANPGAQTLSLAGKERVFMAYGRESDVLAWLNGSSYSELVFDEETKGLVEQLVKADPAGAENVELGSPNPAGSDLWLEEFEGEGSLTRTLTIPEGYGVIVASTGEAVAPDTVVLSWPVDNSTPWATPLLIAGATFLLLGLLLLLLGLNTMRKQQGPRRKSSALPKGKRYTASKTNAIESGLTKPRRPKRSKPTATFGALAIVMALLVGGPVGSAMAETTPVPEATETPAPEETTTPAPEPTPSDSSDPEGTATPEPENAFLPAVTEGQIKTIVDRVIKVATEADAASDASALTSRFAGAALQLREANYKLRAVYPDAKPAMAIPAGPVAVLLPQAINVWPKTLFAIVESEDNTVAPVALMMVQESARSNYKVQYSIALEPDTTLPAVAAASDGTARLAPDSKVLAMAPSDLVTAYADILVKGSGSEFYDKIDTEGDTLLAAAGFDFKTDRKSKLGDSASIDWALVDSVGEEIALATNDSGAIVAVNLREKETVTAVTAGSKIELQGAIKALIGKDTSDKGVEAVYDYQMLFYIPAAGEDAKPTLLGFTDGLIEAKELP